MNTQKTVLITGGSSGIGLELARLFANDRHNLVLVARDADRLIDAAGQLHREGMWVKCVPLDLSEPAAPKWVFDQLAREGIVVDILVNNAGYGLLGDFADVDFEESIGQVQLNIAALTAMTKVFIEPILQRRGKIMNVASTAGLQPGPHMAVYYASKAYVISFSLALANELRSKGVTVTCLCPGATKTAFQTRAGLKDALLFLFPMDAPTVARVGYRALMSGKTLVIPGFRNRLLAKATRISPTRLVIAISRRVLERRHRQAAF
jgi:short-subunit dehydrogenase